MKTCRDLSFENNVQVINVEYTSNGIYMQFHRAVFRSTIRVKKVMTNKYKSKGLSALWVKSSASPPIRSQLMSLVGPLSLSPPYRNWQGWGGRKCILRGRKTSARCFIFRKKRHKFLGPHVIVRPTITLFLGQKCKTLAYPPPTTWGGYLV